MFKNLNPKQMNMNMSSNIMLMSVDSNLKVYHP